ncbi:MAG: hypothetical protein ABSA77_09515, partial [Thermoguttaceae bacterium]
MSDPAEKPKGRINPLLDGEDFLIAAEPVKPSAEPVETRVVPDFVERHIRAAQQKRVSAAEELPPPPRWPMLSGIFLYPFYLSALGSWMF